MTIVTNISLYVMRQESLIRSLNWLGTFIFSVSVTASRCDSLQFNEVIKGQIVII